MSTEELTAENAELVRQLERAHREAEFWHETTLWLVARFVRYSGVNYTEMALKHVVKSIGHSLGQMDPAVEAAKLLVDDYHERVKRLELCSLACRTEFERTKR